MTSYLNWPSMKARLQSIDTAKKQHDLVERLTRVSPRHQRKAAYNRGFRDSFKSISPRRAQAALQSAQSLSDAARGFNKSQVEAERAAAGKSQVDISPNELLPCGQQELRHHGSLAGAKRRDASWDTNLRPTVFGADNRKNGARQSLVHLPATIANNVFVPSAEGSLENQHVTSKEIQQASAKRARHVRASMPTLAPHLRRSAAVDATGSGEVDEPNAGDDIDGLDRSFGAGRSQYNSKDASPMRIHY